MPLPGTTPSTVQGDLLVTGTLTPANLAIPANSVGNSQIKAGAPANYIDSSKLGSRVWKSYAQPNTTATSETTTLHFVNGATGTVIKFQAGTIGVCSGAATITIDLKKNGSSILSAVITLDNSATARAAVNASIASAGLVAGDWLEAVVVATAGGGTIGTGLFVSLGLNEDPT